MRTELKLSIMGKYCTKNKLLLFLVCLSFSALGQNSKSVHPNVIYIYADDLGYGDLSSYGATKIHTPNVDRLAKEGLKFTNAHSTSGTCTPSRYALMTGQYPWRKKGTGILPGDAALIIRRIMPRFLRFSKRPVTKQELLENGILVWERPIRSSIGMCRLRKE